MPMLQRDGLETGRRSQGIIFQEKVPKKFPGQVRRQEGFQKSSTFESDQSSTSRKVRHGLLTPRSLPDTPFFLNLGISSKSHLEAHPTSIHVFELPCKFQGHV